MVTLDQRFAFLSAEFRDSRGTSFSIEGRDWVRDELFRPVTSHKLWPANPKSLCESCKDRAGQMAEWDPELAAELVRHGKRKRTCDGLELFPIMLTVANLQRGAGKTFNTFGLIASILALDARRSIGFVAKAGKQTRTLVKENLLDPIDQSKWMRKHMRQIGDRVEGPLGSFVELVDTAHGSITGRRRDLLVIDEARDIEARTVSALLPSIRARSGWECPRGHTRISHGAGDVPTNCPVCDDHLVPYAPRILIISTSGVIEGSEKDWFVELVEQLEVQPSGYVHLYRTDSAANPAYGDAEMGVLEDVFGAVPSLQTYMEVELRNRPRRKGESFLTKRQIRACMDENFDNVEASARRCFAFLDTSKKHDRTTLVWVAEAEDCERPWETIEVIRYDVWDPKLQPKGVIEQAAIQEHLDYYVPLFPNLEELHVDTRGRIHGMAWTADLVTECRKSRPGWGKKIHAWNRWKERKIAWGDLERRIVYGKIRYPKDPILEKELLGVKKVEDSKGEPDWKDINRNTSHADIAESLANCCYLVFIELSKPRRSFGAITRGKRRSRASEILRSLYRPSLDRPEDKF